MVLETSLGDLRQGRLSSYLTGLLGAQGHAGLPWGGAPRTPGRRPMEEGHSQFLA